MLKLLNFSCSRCLFPSDHSDHFLVNINNYLLTLVFHDQEDSIAEAVTDYEAKLARGDLPNIPFHSEPLMNGHKDLLHDSCAIVRWL